MARVSFSIIVPGFFSDALSWEAVPGRWLALWSRFSGDGGGGGLEEIILFEFSHHNPPI